VSVDRRPEPPPPGTWRQGDGSASSFGAAPVNITGPVITVPTPPFEPEVPVPTATPRPRLVDLEPRWFTLEDGGPKVGLTFLCPHCQAIRLAVAFHHHGHEAFDDSYIRAHYPNDNASFIWDLAGQEDFETLSLFPSVDASASGHWHGSIVDGSMV
jgi:hypothetical protein